MSRYIHHGTATEQVAFTIIIFALTIRIGLLLSTTVQGNTICIFYLSQHGEVEKGPIESMRATNI